MRLPSLLALAALCCALTGCSVGPQLPEQCALEMPILTDAQVYTLQPDVPLSSDSTKALSRLTLREIALRGGPAFETRIVASFTNCSSSSAYLSYRLSGGDTKSGWFSMDRVDRDGPDYYSDPVINLPSLLHIDAGHTVVDTLVVTTKQPASGFPGRVSLGDVLGYYRLSYTAWSAGSREALLPLGLRTSNPFELVLSGFSRDALRFPPP